VSFVAAASSPALLKNSAVCVLTDAKAAVKLASSGVSVYVELAKAALNKDNAAAPSAAREVASFCICGELNIAV
jgi:hypothetical protein